jgi:hypothetical protein
MGCGVMLGVFGVFMFLGWILFDPEDWNGGGKKE